MAYSQKQQAALDAAIQVYKDRIDNISATLDKIEALSLSRSYGDPQRTTHGENVSLKNIMKTMFFGLREDLNVAESLGILTREQYYDKWNAIGERLLAFEAAHPEGFKII